MAADLQQLINSLNAKTRVLSERYALVVNQRDLALEANAELRNALKRSQAENMQLRQRIDNMRTAAAMTPGRADVAASRTLLTDLLREIDMCINELTN